MKIQNLYKALFISLVCFLSFNNNSFSAGAIADIDLDGKADGYDAYLTTFLNGAQPNTLLAPVRFFSMEAYRNPVNELTVEPFETRLFETDASGTILRSWKSKYQKKGHARQACDPPMFNISFDKFNSEGLPKPLFPGWATSPATATSLQYQELRVVERCGNAYDDRLNASVNTQLAESSVFKIMRAMKVPVVDVVAFGKLGFLNAEPQYNGKTFNYMFLSRDNEEDDQVSFSRQFGFNLPIIQDGKQDKWSPASEFKVNEKNEWLPAYNRLKEARVRDVVNNRDLVLSLDPENSLRSLLFLDFFQNGDHSTLHNEDYGQMADGKWRRIMYGFDFDLNGCEANRPNNIIAQYIKGMSDSEKAFYTKKLADVATDIFGKRKNLYKMFLAVDSYPFLPRGDMQKQKLKTYYKLAFYEYARYFSSKEFEDLSGISVSSLFESPEYIFSNTEEYDNAKSTFMNSCVYPALINPPSLVVAQVDEPADIEVEVSERKDGWKEGSHYYGANVKRFDVTIRSDSQDIEFPKYSGFDFKVVDESGRWVADAWGNYSIPDGMTQGIGAYELKKGVTAVAHVYLSAEIYEPNHLGKRKFILKSVSLGRKYNPAPVTGVESKEFSIGTVKVCPSSIGLQPLVQPSINSVSVPSSMVRGQSYDISWTDRELDTFNLNLKDVTGSRTITNIASGIRSNVFGWRVPSYIGEGDYVIEVKDAVCASAFKNSSPFKIQNEAIQYGVSESRFVSSKLIYDALNKESALVSDFVVKVKMAVDGGKIYKTPGRVGLVGMTDLSNSNGPQFLSAGASIIKIVGAIDRGDYFQIPIGVEVTILVRAVFNPNQMFAGNYVPKFTYLGMYDASDNELSVSLTGNSGPAVTVVGERAPLIARISGVVAGLPANSEMTIEGERFSLKRNTVKFDDYINDRHFVFEIAGVDAGHIKFKPADKGIVSGVYNVTVVSVEGASNNFYLNTEEGNQAKRSGFMANILEAIKRILGF